MKSHAVFPQKKWAAIPPSAAPSARWGSAAIFWHILHALGMRDDGAALIFADAKGGNIQKTCNILPSPVAARSSGVVKIWFAKRFSMQKPHMQGQNAAQLQVLIKNTAATLHLNTPWACCGAMRSCVPILQRFCHASL
ncbi:hypothetical protein [Vandammella animalimorsus]|uniref:hypothetical protein n=1 Tax=Vandammella animalimorsus TaxID=2029117 RepID=UPI0011C421D0|nr:hypothetical protein [Vandammella animalimorsus]